MKLPGEEGGDEVIELSDQKIADELAAREHDATEPQEFDGEEHYRCPRRPFLDDDSRHYDFLFRTWRNRRDRHLMPFSGGTEEQSNLLVEAWEVIDKAIDDCQPAIESDAREKARQQAGGFRGS